MPQSLILYCIILILFFKAVILWLIYVLFITGINKLFWVYFLDTK